MGIRSRARATDQELAEIASQPDNAPARLMRVVPVLVPTAVAAALRLTVLADTPTDPFYDAAIRSMGQSWHNFLFAAFEPGGGTSVDKPPIGLWLQVAGVKLFGWGALGRVIPQALASSLAVPLV